MSERARAIAHIPRVLYSWRMAPGSTAAASSAKPYAINAARRALEDAVRRRELPAEVTPSHLNGIFLLRETASEREPNSISTVLTGPGRAWQGISTSGEYLLFLDADSVPFDRGSVDALVEALRVYGAAIAGGMTLVGDDIGQAGLVLGERGQPHYAFAGLRTLPYRSFYLNLKDLPREVSAVWVGCAAMRRDDFIRLGGWDPALPPLLAMADLCLRAWEAGESVVYTPLARFCRREPLPALPPVESHAWRWHVSADPLSNSNLTASSPDSLPFRHGEGSPRVRAAGMAVRR